MSAALAAPARHPGRQEDGAGPVLDWVRTLAEKGPHPLRRDHLRRRPLRAAAPALHLVLLDTSGSMRQAGRLALAKGYAARLVEQAARAGADIGLLSFGGAGVDLVLPPGPARHAGAVRVRSCGGGGGTPLAQALEAAQRLLRDAARRGRRDATVWLLTDGRTREQPRAPAGAGHVVIVDFDHPLRPVGRCADWAARWGAEHRPAPAGAS